ncbi:hypothetical protein SERLA73DRAFT_47551, partial [Serpula lacrymans var. lacrymans S7.3]
LVFLPPYSPDLNPIESAFPSIKMWLRRHSGEGIFSLGKAPSQVTPAKAAVWFKASGYM